MMSEIRRGFMTANDADDMVSPLIFSIISSTVQSFDDVCCFVTLKMMISDAVLEGFLDESLSSKEIIRYTASCDKDGCISLPMG